jgi:hypothetical protein
MKNYNKIMFTKKIAFYLFLFAFIFGGIFGFVKGTGAAVAVGTRLPDGTVYVSPTLRTTSSDAGEFAWGPLGVTVGAVDVSDGRNNIPLLTPLSSYPAAQACKNLTPNFGYNDWYLPARLEMDTLRSNRVAIGNFDPAPNAHYWTSTEHYSYQAYYRGFESAPDYKDNIFSVRCVRTIAAGEDSPDSLPTVTLTANPTSILAGASSTLTWNVTNATSCTATGETLYWAGSNLATSTGAHTWSTGILNEGRPYVYGINCSGLGGSASATTTVTVNAAHTSCGDNPFSDVTAELSHNVAWAYNPRKDYHIGDITLTNTSSNLSFKGPIWYEVMPNDRSWLRYPNGTTTDGRGYVDLTGINLGTSTIYVNSAGKSIYEQLQSIGNGDTALDPGEFVTVTGVQLRGRSAPILDEALSSNLYVSCPVPTVTLSSNPPSILAGASSTLTWNVANVTSCTATTATEETLHWKNSDLATSTGPHTWDTGILNTVGTSTYGIICTGPSGTASATTTVTVGPASMPTVTISANPSSILVGGSSELTWSFINATSCTATGGTSYWTNSDLTFPSVPYPWPTGILNNDVTYGITCTGLGGTASATVTVTTLVSCGSVDGGTSLTIPQGLAACSSGGNQSGLTGSGSVSDPWYWDCVGSSNTTHCRATKTELVLDTALNCSLSTSASNQLNSTAVLTASTTPACSSCTKKWTIDSKPITVSDNTSYTLNNIFTTVGLKTITAQVFSADGLSYGNTCTTTTSVIQGESITKEI